MHYLTFGPDGRTTFPITILVTQILRDPIKDAYIKPFALNEEEVVVLSLHQAENKKKTPMSEIKAYITEELAPVLNECQTEYVVCTDSDYFKALTGQTKTEANLGYVLPSQYGPWLVLYAPNYRSIFYDPDRVKEKIGQAIFSLVQHRTGLYQDPGRDVIKFAEYPAEPAEIEAWLEKLLQMDVDLTADIEAFSLKHPTSGIGTISFAWSKHEGIAFAVDYQSIPGATQPPFGIQVTNPRVRAALKSFFMRCKRNIKWHSAAYDVYILVYQLFMQDILDTEGLLTGLEVMLRNWDCTKLITYLATNSCAGNKLGLKDNAQEFSGNYAVDEIADITKIPLKQLLQYNLVDSLSTWFVYEKHWPTLQADQQTDIYLNLFKPASWDIIQMQLTGMPVNMERVKEVQVLLEADEKTAFDGIMGSPLVQNFLYDLEEKHVAKRNSELVKKRIAMGDEPQEFNPNSGPQLQMLLYDVLGLPVLSKTENGQPSVDGDTLKALVNHTTNPVVVTLLKTLVEYKLVTKITSSFLPAMLGAFEGPDGWHYLFGNFNLGGTLSGRLSSSKPNLQNLPANSKYAKLIKSCFQAPPGWLLMGLDFDSLEDKISALTTKDPNKLKVYTDGYDGHCLRAYAYFGDQMPDIDPNSVVSINSIAKKYPVQRQDSKVPTFALTYDGTFMTLMTNSGLPMDKAKAIEKAYHELYVVSDKWVSAKLDQASKDGYVTVAFGLRVRTPLLKQVIRKTSKTPYEAEAEGRSAGNALGQSWCLLNSRAWMAFMQTVRASKHRLSIRPSAQIHDAGYSIVKDDISVIQFMNRELVKEVKWQAHPDIQHHEVKLGGKLGIFWPTWAKEITLPNGATQDEIFSTIDQAMA